MKVFFGSDHAGFELKNALLSFVRDTLGNEVEDCGPVTLDVEDDYPDTVRPAVLRVSERPDEYRGIILGASGQGEAIVANRVKGIRAVVYYGGPSEIVTLSREHNDANVLSLGARFLREDEAKETVRLWLQTPFSNEVRHLRRIEKIDSEG